jgi:hypothetical protein
MLAEMSEASFGEQTCIGMKALLLFCLLYNEKKKNNKKGMSIYIFIILNYDKKRSAIKKERVRKRKR